MTDCLQEPAFLIGDVDGDINLSLPPASGEEYIKRVVIEAQQCADVVVANIDRSHFVQPTINVQPNVWYHFTRIDLVTDIQRKRCVEAPSWLGPTLDWQQYQFSDFSNVRLYISQLKDEIQSSKRKWRPPPINLPDIDDEKGWVQFCLGTYEGNQKSDPVLNTMFSLNQPMVEQILEYLVDYVQEKKEIIHKLGQWLYALLAILEMPLTPEMCSCLRSLARTCSIIRANSINLEVHEIGALNLFICLVARYFRQLDMADP